MIQFREVPPPENKQSYMMIDFNHSKIKTTGRKAIGDFLQVNLKNNKSFFLNPMDSIF